MAKRKQEKTQTSKQSEKAPSFWAQIAALPVPLQKKFWRQSFAAICIVALTIFMLIYFRDWSYCFGFLMAIYISYLGFDVLWQYQKNRIVSKKMLCKHVRTEIGRLHLIMKDMEAQPGTDESAVQEFNVAVSKKEKKLFAANVVFNIHYSLDNPLVIIAWEVVDVVD